MASYGKYTLLDASTCPKDEKESAIIVLSSGDNHQCDLHYSQTSIIVTTEYDFKTYKELEGASQRFKKIYIRGVNAIEFMVFCILSKFYRARNPKSHYVVPKIVQKLYALVPHDTLINMSKLIQLELQLKILSTYTPKNVIC